MNNTDKTIEQVYRCHGLDAQGRECGQLHPESTISVRPGTKTLYCDQCQSEDVRLCEEVEGMVRGRWCSGRKPLRRDE